MTSEGGKCYSLRDLWRSDVLLRTYICQYVKLIDEYQHPSHSTFRQMTVLTKTVKRVMDTAAKEKKYEEKEEKSFLGGTKFGPAM